MMEAIGNLHRFTKTARKLIVLDRPLRNRQYPLNIRDGFPIERLLGSRANSLDLNPLNDGHHFASGGLDRGPALQRGGTGKRRAWMRRFVGICKSTRFSHAEIAAPMDAAVIRRSVHSYAHGHLSDSVPFPAPASLMRASAWTTPLFD
jgi:hypothetical protein